MFDGDLKILPHLEPQSLAMTTPPVASKRREEIKPCGWNGRTLACSAVICSIVVGEVRRIESLICSRILCSVQLSTCSWRLQARSPGLPY